MNMKRGFIRIFLTIVGSFYLIFGSLYGYHVYRLNRIRNLTVQDLEAAENTASYQSVHADFMESMDPDSHLDEIKLYKYILISGTVLIVMIGLGGWWSAKGFYKTE